MFLFCFETLNSCLEIYTYLPKYLKLAIFVAKGVGVPIGKKISSGFSNFLYLLITKTMLLFKLHIFVFMQKTFLLFPQYGSELYRYIGLLLRFTT